MQGYSDIDQGVNDLAAASAAVYPFTNVQIQPTDLLKLRPSSFFFGSYCRHRRSHRSR